MTTAIPLRRWFFALLTLAALVAGAGCGRTWGKLQRLDLTTPGETALIFESPRAFRAGEGRLNTYERHVNGELQDRVSRTFLQPSDAPQWWAAVDVRGSWMELRVDESSGVSITSARSRTYGGELGFREPLLLAPARMLQNERHTQSTEYIATYKPAKSDEPTSRTGTVEIVSWFAGVETVETPMGRIADAVRLDSRVNVALPLGFAVSVAQRQWFHRDYGEVLRDADGSAALMGVPVKTFTFREAIANSAEIDRKQLESMREMVRQAREMVATTPTAR